MELRTICRICVLSAFFAHQAAAQLPTDRMSSGVMYYAGDTVKSIRLGLYTVVPAGWKAVLPRDTEVAVLVPEENSSASMYVLLNENMTINQQRTRMEQGFELTEGLTMAPDGPVTRRTDDVVAVNAKLTGEKSNKQAKFYIESKCNPVGYCLAFVLQADAQSLEKGKAALQQLSDHTVFQDMSHISPYANFKWKEFLSNKLLLRFRRDASGEQEDELDLCADGTFKAHITRTGGFEVASKEYAGKNKGTWTLTSENDRATLTLSFKKLKPITLEIQGKDEQIYVNGHRYFVGESESCQ